MCHDASRVEGEPASFSLTGCILIYLSASEADRLAAQAEAAEALATVQRQQVRYILIRNASTQAFVVPNDLIWVLIFNPHRPFVCHESLFCE